MLEQAIAIGDRLSALNTRIYPREVILDNWAQFLFRFSVNIAKTFTFLFERMLAGGAMSDCPLPPMSKPPFPSPGWR